MSTAPVLTRRAPRRSALVIAGVTLWAGAQMSAQARAQGTPSVPPTVLAVEQRVTDRWLHSGQQPRFTSFNSHDDWMFVDSTRATDAERRLYITLTYPGDTAGSAIIVAGRTGQVESLHSALAPQPGRELPLPATRLWDVVLTFPNETPRIGLVWTDTIARVAVDGASRQSLKGSRVSRIVGDTLIGGRRLWVVHDSAAVDYEEGYIEPFDSTARVSRTGSGTIRGVDLYDSDAHLIRWREDTTRLAGEAVWRDPDGRSLRTPARYERDRRLDVFDAATYSAVVAKRYEAADRATGGMVVVATGPSSELERRLLAGDATAGDSILREWQHATDPYETERLYRMLAMWGRGAARPPLDDIPVSAGDTTFLLELLERRVSSGGPIDTADMRSLIHVMDDPSIAWRFNVNPNWLFGDLLEALTRGPRAAAAGYPNAPVACTVAACRLLGDQWTTAHEPRLRDVGLVALVSVDPRRWADTVLALDGPSHPLLHSAAQLANGAGRRTPLPPPNGDWHAWREWMNDVDLVTTIRFYVARTGRDIVSEWRRGYAAASSDSARLVFATMLRGFVPSTLTEAEMVDAFASRSPARVALARLMLPSELASHGGRMPDANATSLIDRVVAAAVEGTPLWRSWTTDIGPAAVLPGVHADMNRLFLQGDSLPAAFREKWGSRLAIVGSHEWATRDPRQGGVFYKLAPVRQWGRFARVVVTISERISRRAGEASREYAAGETYYLMRVNNEWVLVDEDSWIT